MYRPTILLNNTKRTKKKDGSTKTIEVPQKNNLWVCNDEKLPPKQNEYEFCYVPENEKSTTTTKEKKERAKNNKATSDQSLPSSPSLTSNNYEDCFITPPWSLLPKHYRYYYDFCSPDEADDEISKDNDEREGLKEQQEKNEDFLQQTQLKEDDDEFMEYLFGNGSKD
eukprot:CAMPEP_0178964734 /NCGR_PEP_ID=MMETSP0789-20121207/15853_1 /TAXON_ID=3005 /ORGANISM="Rhizosolenia setigera, Strain CCMP 1694" /LENGTH=167 /DNA_ID=CAMNT_0020649565 /DNA_START=149 /DNA_END=652 /DNA_ORIENTATION=+